MNLFLRFLFMGAVCLLPLVGCSDDDTEGTGPEPTSDFQFETLELTQGSFKVKITPEDKNMTYFFGVLEKSDFSQFENLESLQAANIENIKALAEANGVGVEEFLLEALLKGEQEWKYNTLVPETDYVFYAYGLSTELEILTTVNTYEFKTLVVEQVEVNFKITASDVTPTSFTLNVEPDRTDCVYYYDILLPAVYMDYCGGDPANLPAFVENYLAEWKKTERYATYTLPEFIAEVTVSGKTSDSSFENLLPEGTYYAFAVCVANDGTCISEATVETIRTSESPKNSYTVSSEVVTDVAYSAVVTAEQSEAFAVMMELQEYFADAKSDAEIIQTIYDAYNQNISKYLYADVANVSFGGLIPNDKYYLLIFACNPDGSPKLDDKINLKKVEVNTSPAAMSSVQYELSVSSIAKIDAMVTVRADGNYENETFLFNYITKAEYDAISGDKTAGLKAHTTEPVTTQFTTVADQVTLASLEFIVMSYGYPEENRDMYRVWTYANNSKEHYFQSFVGEDEWAGKTASEVRELLKASKWPSSSSYKVDAQFGQTWYGYSVAYDEAGIPTKVYKLWHTSPADTGDGFNNITGGTITVDIEELSE